MSTQWYPPENAAASAAALADAVAETLQDALDKKGQAVLAVSGGRSPIAFFDALSQKDLDWQHIGITLVDERIVPTDHTDSNTGLVREYLLKNKAAAAHWIPMVADGADEAALADSEKAVAFALQHGAIQHFDRHRHRPPALTHQIERRPIPCTHTVPGPQ